MTDVVITGYGVLTALGNDLASTWSQLQEGKTGIAPITQWDISDWRFPLGGELKDFDVRQKVFDKKILKLISRHDVIGLNAAEQAVQHSGLLDYRSGLDEKIAREFNERTGIYVGAPGNKYYQQYDFMPLFAKDMPEFAAELFNQVNPMWLLKILPNNVLAYAAIHYGFKGANQNITNHGVSGLQAVIEAYRAISNGLADRALVIAYDAAFEPQSILYYGESGLLSNNSVRPFDCHRNGTVLAEGAGALLLESKAAAQQRDATIYGEILAGSVTSEATGIFALQPEGEGVTRVMEQVLAQGHVAPQDIGMITAHGNGNIQSDATEAYAIRNLFKEPKPTTSFKWAIGHTLAAAGVIETVLTLQALQQKVVPGIATLQQLGDDCRGIAVENSPQIPHSSLGLMLGRGFGGLNASVLIKA